MTTKPMLQIHTDHTTLRTFIAALDKSPIDGWSRVSTPASESQISLAGREYFIYESPSFEGSPAEVWLVIGEDGRLEDFTAKSYADDEGPDDEKQFRILRGFRDAILPVANGNGIRIELSESGDDFASRVGITTMSLLERFAAFPRTSIEHPDDAKRWYCFVIEAEGRGSQLQQDDLRHWLQSKGWSVELATTLARDYRHGRELLRLFKGKNS